MLAQLKSDFPDDLRVVYRHFPLSGHDKAPLASQASEAAGLQGMFWEMHDLLYDRQGDWAGLSVGEFEVWLIDQAASLGLDADRFAQDLNSDEVVAIVQAAYETAVEMALPGTPYLTFDGEPIPSQYYSYENLYDLLAYYLVPLGRLGNMQFTECPPMTIDPDRQYTATLVTEKGDIRIALFPDVAPFAVNSFIFLAENDFYDNVSFHRVIEGFMAQGGDPSGTGMGGPGYYFNIEPSEDLSFDRAGLFAMANAGPTSNGSQFFITYGPAQHLDGGFTIFGEVLEGMDVALSLTPRDPESATTPGDLILDVIIEVQ